MGSPPLEFLEHCPSAPANASIIWLHGLGADGHDFMPIIKELKLADSIAPRFILPHAPLMPITINAGYAMRAWYDLYHPDIFSGEDAKGIRSSCNEIEKLVHQERSRGIAASRVLLAGFSQGGALALHTALRFKVKLAGVIALSCYLPLADTLAAEISNKDVPIFMAHGLYDEVIPLRFAELSRDKLREVGCQVSWHKYPITHTVSDAEISDVSDWIAEKLK